MNSGLLDLIRGRFFSHQHVNNYIVIISSTSNHSFPSKSVSKRAKKHKKQAFFIKRIPALSSTQLPRAALHPQLTPTCAAQNVSLSQNRAFALNFFQTNTLDLTHGDVGKYLTCLALWVQSGGGETFSSTLILFTL